MNKFKVGDRVQVRGWEDMKQKYGMRESVINLFPCFAHGMRHLCLRTATVKNSNPLLLNLENWSDDSGQMDFAFTEQMFKPAPKPRPKPKLAF